MDTGVILIFPCNIMNKNNLKTCLVCSYYPVIEGFRTVSKGEGVSRVHWDQVQKNIFLGIKFQRCVRI
jgi:hypothetical protein